MGILQNEFMKAVNKLSLNEEWLKVSQANPLRDGQELQACARVLLILIKHPEYRRKQENNPAEDLIRFLFLAFDEVRKKYGPGTTDLDILIMAAEELSSVFGKEATAKAINELRLNIGDNHSYTNGFKNY